MISGRKEINSFAKIHLKVESKFGDDTLDLGFLVIMKLGIEGLPV